MEWDQTSLIVESNGKMHTRREWMEHATCAAKQLFKDGVAPGDRIGICGFNSVEYLVWMGACWLRGASAVLCSKKESEYEQAEFMKQVDCHTSLDISLPPFLLKPCLPSHSAAMATKPPWDSTLPAVVIGTSGTTGCRKGAVLSLENLFSNAEAVIERVTYQKGDRWLLSLPLWHVGGLSIFIRALLSHGEVAIADPKTSLEEALHYFQPSHLSLVPTQLMRLIENPSALSILHRCKAIVLGGAASPVWLLERSKQLSLPVMVSYGLTEMGSQVACSPIHDIENGLETLSGIQIAISEREEVFVCGPSLFLGYQKGDQLERSRDEEGFLHTRDRGSFCQNRLKVDGRLDHRMFSGGQNLYPEEIERVLSFHPSVRQAVVVPIEHPEYGERPVAFVDILYADLDQVDLKTHMRQFLSKWKTPDHIWLWPEQLKGLDGKWKRSDFQELARRYLCMPKANQAK